MTVSMMDTAQTDPIADLHKLAEDSRSLLLQRCSSRNTATKETCC